ncbi:MAG TPA: tetratricopeptide repeat protein [Acidobacteriota bacterium]|nr:tetratricopeptide repeat protein [Acidobacteriota bacterium]HRR56018.1 tetratricopeptide repeat protein [Acidobacteriota bacterium]HRV09448.1 tetratricopeptide repeat protein [Acidobacteriota bacterium]
MQPFRCDLPGLLPPDGPVEVGDRKYYVQFTKETAEFFEESLPERRFALQYVLGGKNVYYFLAPLEKGRLQVLPVAFDVPRQEWFDATGSMVRHFRDREDQPLDWTDRRLTFNTSCFHCHVSQLAKNYDPFSDTYATSWLEPGVNCETCHGPGAEHARLFEKLEPEDPLPADIRILSFKHLNSEQIDSTCAACHAKLYPVSTGFVPGEDFFDHFGLVTLEDPDYHPDGRDLGENYTFTQWMMNPCRQAADLNCLHCHTSSGRNRHAEAPDAACLPCHAELVEDPEPHTHHPANSEGSRCIACHLPRTEFARMVRHDHSFLPPVPAATEEFGSPNACNLCHDNQRPAWADRWVRRWYSSNYQAPLVRRARMIAQARKGDWSHLTEWKRFFDSPERDTVFAASLLLLLRECPSDEKWPLIRAGASAASPLVRQAAVRALADAQTTEDVQRLFGAANDPVRLVRFSAVTSLVESPVAWQAGRGDQTVAAAVAEYRRTLTSLADDWSARYNLGNIYLQEGAEEKALAAFRHACRLEAPIAAPWVNLAVTSARVGRTQEAESALREGLQRFPEDAALHFNLGLWLAETGRGAEAEQHLRRAWESGRLAAAAYNLAVLLGEQQRDEALIWARRAAASDPGSPRYRYTLGFYLARFGREHEAVEVLRDGLVTGRMDRLSYILLAELLAQQGRVQEAREVFERAAADPSLRPDERAWFARSQNETTLSP